MNFNNEQQKAIKIRNHAIISAGAGAGKTAVLVARYIDLLHDTHINIENILCLTFTRKAAREMYIRIYENLSKSQNEYLKQKFLHFDKARITTIDSFCSHLIRPHLGNYGYPTNITLEDSVFHQELEHFTFKYISNPKYSPIITRLLERFNYEQISKELFISLAINFLHIIPQYEKNTETYNAQHQFITPLKNLLYQKIPLLNEGILLLHQKLIEQQQDKGNKKHHIEAMATLQDLLEEYKNLDTPIHLSDNFSSSIPLLQKLDAAIYKLTGSKISRKPWKELKYISTEIIKIILPIIILLSEEEFYISFYNLITNYLEKVHEFKRKRGILYYRDFIDLAINILQNNTDVADYYRKEIRYIMIDEFQDNNHLQKDLLFLLSAPIAHQSQHLPKITELDPQKGLFFVGDPKQSIYRFRGADVTIFRKLIEDSLCEHISLNHNYRSSPELINFFNKFFPSIMNGTEHFEAVYEPLESGNTRTVDSHIECILIPKELNTNDNNIEIKEKEAEAYTIAKRINEICTTSHLKGKDGKPISYKDIAILFRSSGNQYQIEKMLRLFGIPYKGDSVRSLFLDAPMYDTHSFLKHCIFPEDQYSLVALLRSPFCRLSDTSILLLCNKINNKELKMGERLDHTINIPSNEIEHYHALLTLLEDFRPMIGKEPHIYILGELWKRSGYFEFIKTQHKEYIEHYNYLLEFFHVYNDHSMIDILEIIEENLNSMNKLSDIDIYNENDSGVRLMTVHSAKGLEFPVVFLVDCNTRPHPHVTKPWISGNNNNLVLFAGIGQETSEKYTISQDTILNPLYEQLKAQELKQENAENRRLLYVALTRAEQHLFITASGMKITENNQIEQRDEPKNENFFDLIYTGLGLDNFIIEEESNNCRITKGIHYQTQYKSNAGNISITLCAPLYKEELNKTKLHKQQKIHTPHTQPFLMGPPCMLDLPNISSKHISVSELVNIACYSNKKIETNIHSDLYREEPSLVTTDIQHGKEAEFGTFVHTLLEKTIVNFLNNEKEYIPPPLDAHNNNFYEEARELVQKFTKTIIFQQLAQADEVCCELPFILHLSSYYIHGKVDLLVQTPKHSLLIDYKTGHNINIEDYQMQIDLYRIAATHLNWQNIEAGIFNLREGEFYPIKQRFTYDDITHLLKTQDFTK